MTIANRRRILATLLEALEVERETPSPSRELRNDLGRRNSKPRRRHAPVSQSVFVLAAAINTGAASAIPECVRAMCCRNTLQYLSTLGYVLQVEHIQGLSRIFCCTQI